MDRMPVSHRAITQRQTPFTLTFTPMGKLESPINQTCISLVCMRKQEPKKNNVDMCKGHQVQNIIVTYYINMILKALYNSFYFNYQGHTQNISESVMSIWGSYY